MFKVYIQGLRNGDNQISLEQDSDVFNGKAERFTGKIFLNGRIFKNHSRYTLTAEVEATALLNCDWTLKDFEEKIETSLEIIIVESVNQETSASDNDEVIILDKDQKYLDITEKVYEELVLALPMKRLSPEVKEKSFDELYPEVSAEKAEQTENKTSDVWAALKNVKLN